MRWFSFNDSAKFYHSCVDSSTEMHGQLWALKMILEHHFSLTKDDEDEPAAKVELPTNENEPMEELRKLKAQTGQLRLAPMLITEDNLWVLDLVMEVSGSSWFAYGTKAKTVKSPNDAIVDAMKEQQGQWQTELVDLVANCLNGANGRQTFIKLDLLNCNAADADYKTTRLVDVVLLIIHHRARSGATMTSLFPHRQPILPSLNKTLRH